MAPERMAVITSCVFPPMPSLWHQLGTSGGHTVQMEGQLGSPRSPWTEMKQTVGAGLEWKNVARQLKEDLSSIILLSEEELRVLTDVPCSEPAQKLSQSCVAVRGLQNTLQ